MDKAWFFSEHKDKPYLHNKVLSFKPFLGSKGTHDHCELCWARFSTHPVDLHSGYYEPLSKSWICSDCYNECAYLFGWTVENATL